MATSTKNRRKIAVDDKHYSWAIVEDEDRWCDFYLTIASADHGDDFYVAFELAKRDGGFAVTKARFQASLAARRKIDVQGETLPAAVGPKHVAALIRWARAAVAAT